MVTLVELLVNPDLGATNNPRMALNSTLRLTTLPMFCAYKGEHGMFPVPIQEVQGPYIDLAPTLPF